MQQLRKIIHFIGNIYAVVESWIFFMTIALYEDVMDQSFAAY